jgi:hypothetical protein
MKKFALLISSWFVLSHSYAQTNNSIGVDCSPKLNEQEISYLDNIFSASNYDFKNKTIGFAAHKVKKICRVPAIAPLNMRLPINKKEYFTALGQDTCKTTTSKLLVLNYDQKKQSGGFDAIVLLVPKKKEQKVGDKTTYRLAEVFGYRTLNYPDNLHLVGNDNSAELTENDAVFFNSVYHNRNFDFKGKKIAFMNPHLLDEKQAIRTKKEYIEKIKKHLENDFLYPGDDLEILNEQEKIESGGYDAMIVYQSKRYFKTQLIKALKEKDSQR